MPQTPIRFVVTCGSCKTIVAQRKNRSRVVVNPEHFKCAVCGTNGKNFLIQSSTP